MPLSISHHEENQATNANSIKHVLRPIVKFMIKQNMTYTLLCDLLKDLFIEVAEKELALTEKRVSDASISLVTRVHRKDVKRLRGNTDSLDRAIPENVSLGMQIIGRWHSDPTFLDDTGLPLPLVRETQDKMGISFYSLVRSVSKDIHPRAVQDEWLRLGIVYLDNEENIALKNDIFIPQSGWEEKMFFFRNNLQDHANALVHNICSNEKPLLERCVHFEGVNASQMPSIAKLAEKLSMKALREVNQKVLNDAEESPNDTTDKMRMTYGVYMYYEPSSQTQQALENKHIKKDG